MFENGSGTITHVVCMTCGTKKVTNTWAENRATGERGLLRVSYIPLVFAAEVADIGAQRAAPSAAESVQPES